MDIYSGVSIWLTNLRKSATRSELEYQKVKGIIYERTSLKESVLLTSQIRIKGTCKFFYNTFGDIP